MVGATTGPRAQRRGWRLKAATLAATVTVMLVGCSPGASVSLTLDPTSGALMKGSSLEVDVSLTRSGGASGDVALSVTGLPAGVTAAFSPATLTGGADTSTMTLAATGSAPVGAATLTVSATGAEASDSAQFTLEVVQLDVEGRVVGILSQPVAGVTVMVDGHASVMTGADGAFSFSDVTAPYDVTIADLTNSWANVFVGLTAANPELFSVASLGAPASLPTATVEGDLDSPVPADHQTQVCVEGIDFAVHGCGSVIAGQTAYSVSVNWLEGNSAPVRLRALEFSIDAEFNPVALTGAGASAVFSLTEGGTTNADLVVGAPVATVPFTLNVATSYPSTGYQGLALSHLSDTFSLSLGSKFQPTTPVTALAPFFSGATYTVVAGAQTSNGGNAVAWQSGLTASTTVTLEPPEPPEPTAPADAAVGINYATSFNVSNPAGGVLNFLFQPNFPAVGPTLAVTTSETSATIPNLSGIGLALPAAQDYNWSVYAIPSASDLDEAVTSERNLAGYIEVALALQGGGAPETAEGSISLSGQRTFTVQ